LKILVFLVTGVSVVVRKEIRMCGAVRQVVHVFVLYGPIFIAAVITQGL
jgi:hypothetical protein